VVDIISKRPAALAQGNRLERQEASWRFVLFFHIRFALKHFRSLRRAQHKATVTTIALYNGENRLMNRPEMMTTQQKYNFIMTTVRE